MHEKNLACICFTKEKRRHDVLSSIGIHIMKFVAVTRRNKVKIISLIFFFPEVFCFHFLIARGFSVDSEFTQQLLYKLDERRKKGFRKVFQFRLHSLLPFASADYTSIRLAFLFNNSIASNEIKQKEKSNSKKLELFISDDDVKKYSN